MTNDSQNHICETYCDSDCTCGCCENGKKTATLLFRRHAILYDVSNIGYVEADIMPDEQQDAKHQTFDIGQDGNRDRVTRIMNLSMCEMEDALYPFTRCEIPEEKRPMDDLLHDPCVYVMKLRVPQDFSFTTLKLLRELIHEYIVCRVMGDWLGITKPDAASSWLVKAEEVMAKVKKAITSRRGKVRRPLKPF